MRLLFKQLNIQSCVLFCTSLAFVFVVSLPVVAQQSAQSFSSISEVISNWNEQQHLYVRGAVGVSGNQLSKLESWLDNNGRHWTVVLMDTASGQFYQAPDGRRFQGMDAVEYALGYGLANETDFGRLEHEKTGQSDGAVFVLFLRERKFSYYGSDAQDTRRLGESQWIGNLDRQAVRAMRSGGRIIDAVRNTVTSINGKLEQEIVREAQRAADAKAAAERKERERLIEIERLKASIDDTRNRLLPTLRKSAEKFREDFPEAVESELALPPLGEWEVALTEAKKAVGEEAGGEKTVKNVIQDVNSYLDSYAAHREFGTMAQPVRDGIQELTEDAVADPMVDSALSMLEKAQTKHRLGELGFAKHLEEAEVEIEKGRAAVEAAKIRQKQELERQSLIRKTLATVGAILGGLMLLVFYLLNRKRRPAMKKAQDVFARTDARVQAELTKLRKVTGRARDVLGTRKEFAERGFEGMTHELGTMAHDQLSDLERMETELERVMGEADGMINPSSPISQFANLFTRARYDGVVQYLLEENIVGPPTTRAPDGSIVYVADRDQPKWQPMTFDKFFESLDERLVDSHEAINKLETSFSSVDDRLGELQTKINDLAALEEKLSGSADKDGHFQMPALFSDLLPSAQAEQDRAESIARVDPVRAVDETIPLGARKTNDALSVAKSVSGARANLFPVIEKSVPQLQELGYDTRWIDQRVEELGDQANRLMFEACQDEISDSSTDFGDSISKLGQRTQRSLELGQRIKDSMQPGFEKLTEQIAAGRDKLASSLGISETLSLAEQGRNPDTNLDAIRKQIAAAQSALNYGGIEAADEALAVAKYESTQGESLLNDSMEALTSFGDELEARKSGYASVHKQLPEYEGLIGKMKQAFLPSALFFGDQEGENGITLSDAYSNCQQLLANVQQNIDGASENHRTGRVLESAEIFDDANELTTMAERNLVAIREHAERLESLTNTNQSEFHVATASIKKLGTGAQRATTQTSTIEQYAELTAKIEKLENHFGEQSQRDPFQDSKIIGQTQQQIDELAARIQADENAYAESERAVRGAEAQLKVARELVNRSLRDNIPDSRLTKECQGQIQQLGELVSQVREQLSIPHHDWYQVDTMASALNGDLGVVAGRLRKELENAENAAAQLKHASDVVFRAARWSGSYGVRVVGRPGVEDLEAARRALSIGDYQQTIKLSFAATQQAEHAINAAEREVASRRREERRRAEARRRRRQASSSWTSMGSSRSRRSGGISFGGGSRSSSRSSSRSRSSGSGFSRSGW